jgi:MFS family permease
MASISGRLPINVSLRLLVGVILAGTLSVLDSTIVVPLLGTIAEEFSAGSRVSWLVAAYLLASTVTIPLWGRWMDLRGERTPMWIAVWLFLLGTIVCALAPGLDVLILGRVLQGIGAGGIVPLGQAVLAGRCSSEERAHLQMYYNVAYGTAAGLGPLVGGALLDVSWRWAFWLIVPFVIAVAISLVGELSDEPKSSTHRPFDKLGSALITVGLTAMLLGIERSWWWLLLAGSLVVVWFVMRSLRIRTGLVPRGLLTSAPVMACSFLGLLIGFVQFAFLTYLPLLSQRLDPDLNSGLVVVPLTVLWMTLGAVTGVLAIKLGSKTLVGAAIVCGVLAGIVVAVWFTLPALIVASVLVGACAGLALIPALLLAQHSAPSEDIGAATSTLVLLRNFGGALGVAVTARVFADFGLTATMVMLTAVAAAALVPFAMMPGASKERSMRMVRDHV